MRMILTGESLSLSHLFSALYAIKYRSSDEEIGDGNNDQAQCSHILLLHSESFTCSTHLAHSANRKSEKNAAKIHFNLANVTEVTLRSLSCSLD